MDIFEPEDEWERLVSDFIELSKKGPVISVGEGPTSIKSTFLNQKGMCDRTSHPELGELPIVCRRYGTNLPITGFSKSPVYYSGWNSRELLLKYGIPDKNGHDKALFTNLSSIPNRNHGLHVSSDGANNLVLKDTENNPIAMWSSTSLGNGFEKNKKFVLVDALQTKKEGKKYFQFISLNLVLRKINLEDMKIVEQLIRENHIGLELRMFITENHPHCISRGLEDNRVRDHGTAWRYSKTGIDELFETTKIA